MKAKLSLVLGLSLLLTASASAYAPGPLDAKPSHVRVTFIPSANGSSFTGADLLVAQGCCKVCRKGKARGDTCIARDKVCHQPPGCACDG